MRSCVRYICVPLLPQGAIGTAVSCVRLLAQPEWQWQCYLAFKDAVTPTALHHLCCDTHYAGLLVTTFVSVG